MADKPILFSGAMVRSLLAGTKTQTRRIIKPQPKLAPHHEPVRVERRGERGWVWMVCTDRPSYQFATGDWKAPYAVGTRLYVREMWARVPTSAYRMSDGVPQTIDPNDPDMAAIYAADWERSKPKWKPSIHMPRWASRITLIVTDVRVERLQDISDADALAEGVEGTISPVAGRDIDIDGDYWAGGPKRMYRELWGQINGADAWAANPWVAAYTFTVHLGNIDQVDAA